MGFGCLGQGLCYLGASLGPFPGLFGQGGFVSLTGPGRNALRALNCLSATRSAGPELVNIRGVRPSAPSLVQPAARKGAAGSCPADWPSCRSVGVRTPTRQSSAPAPRVGVWGLWASGHFPPGLARSAERAPVTLHLDGIVQVLNCHLSDTAIGMMTRIAVLKWLYHLYIKTPRKVSPRAGAALLGGLQGLPAPGRVLGWEAPASGSHGPSPQMSRHTDSLFPVLLQTLSDESDEVGPHLPLGSGRRPPLLRARCSSEGLILLCSLKPAPLNSPHCSCLVRSSRQGESFVSCPLEIKALALLALLTSAGSGRGEEASRAGSPQSPGGHGECRQEALGRAPAASLPRAAA